jgi:hypothetical protein
MKNILRTSALAIVATIVMLSCKKDYKCECAMKVNAVVVVVDTTIMIDVKDKSKKQAKSYCEGGQAAYDAVFKIIPLGTATCTLK